MNPLPLMLREEAQRDLDEATNWYDAQREGLGDELLLEIDAAHAAIQERPGSFPAVTRRARRALLKRFPYAIYFQIEQHRIVVTTIVHTARSPRVWKKRLR